MPGWGRDGRQGVLLGDGDDARLEVPDEFLGLVEVEAGVDGTIDGLHGQGLEQTQNNVSTFKKQSPKVTIVPSYLHF